ncbi:MAG: peptide chain release factor N(5)-glutamine methyltransferase [Alphaproteobacteria bacterium]|nr:peptide chain release factor N(5)-glutamine methyltransferase [Alphaproteobacteria bacterium]
MTTGRALAEATRRLAAAGVEQARLDARVLLAHAMGVAPLSLVTWPERVPTPDQQARFETMLARREAREPVARIMGRREFWSLEFEVGPATLDPRPDSETVVDAVLASLPRRDAELALLDFGTGTGCLLLALLSELPRARGLGVDRSAEALAVARRNAIALSMAQRAHFAACDWGMGLAGLFDAIVANPPYIPEDDIAGLAPEVADFDPRGALAGGADGLDCYRSLAPHVARLLAPRGVAVLEVGEGQAQPVLRIAAAAGLRSAGIRRDLAGIERCVVLNNGT